MRSSRQNNNLELDQIFANDMRDCTAVLGCSKAQSTWPYVLHGAAVFRVVPGAVEEV